MTKVTSLYSSTKIMIIAESEYFFWTKLIFRHYIYNDKTIKSCLYLDRMKGILKAMKSIKKCMSEGVAAASHMNAWSWLKIIVMESP